MYFVEIKISDVSLAQVDTMIPIHRLLVRLFYRSLRLNKGFDT